MQRLQLSFTSLRARQLALAVKQKNFTRRQFMGLTGTAALGAASQIKQLRRAFEPLEIKGDEDRLAFLLNGQERWVIDPKLFGGSPQLEIEKTSSRIHFKLSRATYPGTKLPADLTCELNRVGRRWRMHLRMALGNFRASAPFERWLAGDELVTSTSSLNKTAVELGQAGRLIVSGTANATFAPGWVTILRGPRLARILGTGSGLISDGLTVSLLDHDAASFIDQPASKRTLLSLERGQREWQFENSILLPPAAALEPVHDPFDVIHVEAGESRNGAPMFALLAEPSTDDTRLQFQPNNEFKGVFGEPFRLNLRSAILAAAFDQQNHDRILLAQFAHESVWFEGQQFSVELGDAPNEVPFALANRDGLFAHLRCAPALRSTAFYFAGAVVQPSPCPDGSRLIFDSTDGTVPAELDPQRPTPSPSPTPRRIGPIPGIVVRPTPSPSPTATPTPVRRPTPRPTPSATPVATPPPSGVPPGARPPSTVPPSTATPRPTPRPTARPTPEATPTPSDFPPGARPPSTQPTPSPTATPGRPVIPPGVLRPRPTPTPIATPTPESRPTPPPRETPTPAEPSTGVISTRPEDLGDLKLHGTFSTVVIRPEDLLVLRLEFINFSLETGQVDAGGRRAPKLVRDDTGRPSYIAVHLPAQNIAEQAFFETAAEVDVPAKDKDAKLTGSDPLSAPPVRTRIAGPSRLVFRVPNNEGPIDYTLAAILEKCGKYTMSVVPHALPPKSTSKLITVPNKYLLNPVIDKPGLGVKTFRAPTSHQVIQQARVRALISVPGKDLVAMQKEDAAVKSAIASGMAASVRPPKPRAPNASETALELPYLLILSPNTFGAWAHAQLPVTSQIARRTELWHTRLGVRSGGLVDEDNDALRTVRAVWTRDQDFSADNLVPPDHWPGNTLNDKFRTTLDSNDRHNLVHLSSNYTIRNYEPNPVEVERLMLSSMGAWINSRGVWEPPGALTVQEWRQRGTMGRDHYVRVVYKGYLFPFGHHASLVKVTERKFHNDIPGNIAYLRQRMFIIVRQPEKTFGGTGIKNSEGHSYDRQMPFRRVRLTTLVTPNLNKPELSQVNNKAQSLFWPRVGTQDFQFHIVAEDFEGNEIEFAMPLLFADQTAAKDTADMQKAKADLESGPIVERRKRDLRGQKLMLADSSKPGDTSFDTKTITFGVEIPTVADMGKLDPLEGDAPQFYPAVRRAELVIPSLKHIGDNQMPGEIKYADAYLKHGLDDSTNNNGQLFGEFISGVPMNFTGKGDKSGALVTPNMKVSGLSRAMGPVAGDVTKIAGGGFDPASFFGDLSPKIFGCIDLFNLIEKVDGLGNKLDLVPKFVTEALSNVEAFLVETENFRNSLQSISLPGVPALLTDVQTILQTDMPDILKPPFDTIDVKLAKLSSDLSTFSNHFTDLNNALPGADIADGPKRQLQKNIANFDHYLADGSSFINDIKAFAGAIPLELPKEIKVRFDWKPKMKSWGIDPSHPLFIAKDKKGNPCTLLIGIEMRARTDGKGSPSADIICSLENFTLDLIAPASFIKLYFKKLQFLAGTSKKADINVEFGGIEFVGVLSFIEALRSLIPLDGFSDPPALEVDASGIHASFSIALPTLAMGMFSLQNMTLGAGFTIPFIGDPLSVYFNFCSRENPFLLTVAFLGGGGYFGITLDPRGVQLLEAAFEFGACLAVNFFVASGSVHIMAGIYFKIEKGDGSLTGYLRIGGEVSVLGLISASIELRMELTYEFSSGKTVGRATLTIEVHIIFFTISVELTCERKFAGSNGDPSFAQLMAPFQLNGATVKPWEDYCMAFAS